jgi:demethylmenaquinone methyltransferase/2-methoxy-6-polyprenyl-1,4-benzoquinol methylase
MEILQNKKQDKKREWIEQFFSHTGKSYDSVVNIFTLGIDRLWKKKIIEKLSAPKRVLDLACGTGILTTAIAKRFLKCEVVGVDISSDYLEVAWRKAFKNKIKNVSFVLSPAEEFTSQALFDVVTASYLAKYADIPLLIKNLSGMIAPGGTLIFHDFTYPTRRFLQSLFELYFKLVSPLGGILYPEWKEVFHELPNVIRETKWVADITEALKREGFCDIQIEQLTLEGSAIVSARRR